MMDEPVHPTTSSEGLIASLESRHRFSRAPQSLAVVAVLGAVREVLAAEGLRETPTTLFAAVMSSLEREETQASAEVRECGVCRERESGGACVRRLSLSLSVSVLPARRPAPSSDPPSQSTNQQTPTKQVTIAMATVLASVLPRVPPAVLRSRFNGATALLAALLARHRAASAPAAKALLQCLCTALAAYEPSAAPWPSFEGPWGAVLSALLDARPKVRKRAAAGATEVLAALRSGGGASAAAAAAAAAGPDPPAPNPALAPASDALLRLCGEVLPAPEAAARAAAQAPGRRRAEAEEGIARAVADALHLMGALRGLLPLASPAAARGAVQLLLRLYALRQPLLSRHATDVLTALAQEQQSAEDGGGDAATTTTTTTSGLDPPALAQLLSLLLKSQSDATLWDRRSPEALVGVARLVVVCEGSLTDAAPAAAAARLPQAAAALVSLLGAEQEAARYGAAEALRELVRHAVTDDVCAARGVGSSAAVAAVLAAAGGDGGGGGPSAAATADAKRRPPPIDGVVAAVASSLSARYEEAWGHALPVVSALIERIGEAADAVEQEMLQKAASKGKAGSAASAAAAASAASAAVTSAAAPLLRALGELCAGAFDAGEDEGGEGGEEGAVAAMLGSGDDDDDNEEEEEEGGEDGGDDDNKAARRDLRRRGREAERRALAAERRAQRRAARRYSASCESAMASALRALGPEAVLAVLPLNVREGVMAASAAAAAGQQQQAGGDAPLPPEARTWMLPLLRRHVRGARLAFWASELLPLARFLGARAAAASAAGQRLHALNCHTLERQAWAALPAFCAWPRDAAAAYPPLAQALASAARQREDLRPFVCGALERLARQARAVCVVSGDSEGLLAHLELEAAAGAEGGRGGAGGRKAAAGGDGDGDGEDEEGDGGEQPSSSDDGAARPDEDDEDDGDGDDDEDDDQDDDDYANGRRPSMLALGPRACAADAAGRPGWFTPAGHAAPQARALRAHGKDWLPLLLRAFLASEPSRRGPIGSAIAALASVAEPGVTSALLQTALGRLARCARDAAAVAAGESPCAAEGEGGLVLEGGSTPAERVSSHLDVCVCLSAGVPRGASGAEALGAIFAAARPMVLAARSGGGGGGAEGGGGGNNNNNKDAVAAGANAALLQKRGYKALAALAEARPEWLREQMPALLELLLRAGPVAATAARRQRLRLLRAVLLALLAGSSSGGGGSSTGAVALPPAADLATFLLDPATGRERVPGAAALSDPSTPAPRRAALLAAALVAELVLSTKEANVRAREAAYALLVELAAEMHAARPPKARAGGSMMLRRMMEENGDEDGSDSGGGGEGGDDDDDDDDAYGADPAAAADAGGLRDFVNMVCAGLAGGSPHMISATVMALARLVHAFPGELASKGGAAPRLLPAVLTLLRSKAREVVKSVLGFAKVCASRLPADVLAPLLPTLLEGVLLWSDDSRNRFRLRVRAVVERLCRRLGVEAVSAAAPASEAKLLTHIRKQAARKARKREGLFGNGGASSAGGSQVSLCVFWGGFVCSFRASPPSPPPPPPPLKKRRAPPRPPPSAKTEGGRAGARKNHTRARPQRAVAGRGARAEQAARFSRGRGENPQAGARPFLWRDRSVRLGPTVTPKRRKKKPSRSHTHTHTNHHRPTTKHTHNAGRRRGRGRGRALAPQRPHARGVHGAHGARVRVGPHAHLWQRGRRRRRGG